MDFEDLYENAPVGYLVLRPDGRIISANATFARWIGTQPGDLQNVQMRDLLTLPGRIVYETSLAPLLKLQGGFEEVALDFSTLTAGKIPVLASATVQLGDAGEAPLIRLALFRSPARRNYERSLQAREERAQKGMADELNNAGLREEFIAVLGHDLRNPLAAIIGAARLLRRENLSAKSQNIIELMEASIDRMAGLIDDVLDFARGRLGSGMGVDRTVGLLEPMLRQVVSELEVSQPGREILLEVYAPYPVSFDQGRLAQLVSNLVGNALTHGDPRLPVRIHAAVDGGMLELWIANSGEPISEAALPRLFQPFFRGEVRASRQGLGLGLHIASEIAKAHGGSIVVVSDAVETRFTLRMPSI